MREGLGRKDVSPEKCRFLSHRFMAQAYNIIKSLMSLQGSNKA